MRSAIPEGMDGQRLERGEPPTAMGFMSSERPFASCYGTLRPKIPNVKSKTSADQKSGFQGQRGHLPHPHRFRPFVPVTGMSILERHPQATPGDE